MNKKIIASLLMAIGVSAFNLAYADEGRGIYVGAFGGVGRSDNQDVEQTGVAHKRGDYAVSGYADFDLKVDVKGKAKRDTSGLGGVHVGYEWATTSFKVKPAVELELMYMSSKQESDLANPNTEVISNIGTISGGHADPTDLVAEHYAGGEHRFRNSMDMNMGLLMVNGLMTYDSESIFKPYVGAGVGLALINMNSAVSYQTNPSGPIEQTSDTHENVNHFNSKTHSTDYAFAGQLKLGVRAEITKNVYAFAEYRYLYVSSTDYTFGSTVYTGHAPTDNWNVKNESMGLHNGLVGVEYAF